MHFTRLSAPKPWSLRLDLHDHLTVIHGLGPERRAWLADAIAAVGAGSPTKLTGRARLEGGGSVALSDPAVAEACAGIPILARATDLMAVPESSTLPARPPALDAPEPIVPEASAPLDAEVISLAALHGDGPKESLAAHVTSKVDPDLERMARALAEEEAGHRASLKRTEAAVEAIAVAISQDPDPDADLVSIGGALADARRSVAADLSAEQAAAEALAREWDALEERRERLTTETAPAWLVQSARKAVQDADAVLEQARRDAGAGDALDLEAVAELEAAHANLVDLEARAGLTNLSVKRQLAAAQVVEDQLLERLGLSSYDSLPLRIATDQGASGAIERLRTAEGRMQEAQAMWDSLQPPDDDPAVVALAEASAMIRRRAAVVLGYEPAADPRAELLSWMPVAPPVGSSMRRLWAALVDLGLDVDADDHPALLAAGERWLDMVGDAGSMADLRERKSALLAEAAGLRAEIGNITSRRQKILATVADLEHGLVAGSTAARDAAAMIAAHAEATAAHARAVEEHKRWAKEHAKAERAWTRALAKHDKEMASHPPADPEPSDQGWARSRESRRRRDSSPVEGALLARLGTHRMGGSSGSVPMVIDEAFHLLPAAKAGALFDLLARMSVTVQVIYLTDDKEIAERGLMRGDEASVIKLG